MLFNNQAGDITEIASFPKPYTQHQSAHIQVLTNKISCIIHASTLRGCAQFLKPLHD